MSVALLTARPAARRRSALNVPPDPVSRQRDAARVSIRTATAADAPVIHALIEANREAGHLLARALDELTVHAARFVVAVGCAPGERRRRVLGCAELAPLSPRVAEVRSLVVDRSVRSNGIGRELVDELRKRANRDGFDRLTAFTHDAAYFVRKGFSIVPHVWVPEKIALDCHQCALFRKCGQHAVVLPLAARS